ncbi:MBL fold metallo-hydrolase [Rhodococcus opacus]|nr:MBL fold metallo-hydrolase [Rhodococcus opacus]MBV6760349.1 MBL fold metallo-hydrolase [Rhodococcus opacus]
MENALTRLGVCADDVDLVINTHLHWDHCSNSDVFRNAEILVQRDELGYAAAPCAEHLRAYGITAGFVPPFARLAGRPTGWKPLPSHDHTVVENGTFGY